MKVRLPVEYTTRVEMLPLIDIVFLLLVFFIYAMLSMAVHRGMEVNLPVSASAQPDNEPVLSVTVRQETDRSASIFVDKVPVQLADLTTRLKEEAAGHKAKGAEEPMVLLFADQQVPYQELFRVLDRISQAGLSRISLQADAEQQ